MQKKIITYIIIFFIIICSATYTYAKVDTSLDNFIKTYGIENMSANEINKKLNELKSKNNTTDMTFCINYANTVIADAEQQKTYEKKISKLESEFENKCKKISDENDPIYLYYGYALGNEKIKIKNKQEEVEKNANGKTPDELQKEFDNTLSEYNSNRYKGSTEERYKRAQEYYDKLNIINNLIKDKDTTNYRYNQNDKKIQEIQKDIGNFKKDNENYAGGQIPGGIGGGEDKKEGTDAVLGESSASPNHTLDEIIKEGNSFLSQAEKGDKINELNLKSASDTLYNILLSIGIAMTVIIGMYLGAKFMLSSAEDKAKVKEALIPYIAGCVVIYGAFVIWKLVIVLLGGIA